MHFGSETTTNLISSIAFDGSELCIAWDICDVWNSPRFRLVEKV